METPLAWETVVLRIEACSSSNDMDEGSRFALRVMVQILKKQKDLQVLDPAMARLKALSKTLKRAYPWSLSKENLQQASAL